jgi:hypothetical protein
MNYKDIFTTYHQKKVSGRYVTNETIIPFLEDLNDNFKVSIEGYSVLEKPIFSVQFGHGKIKIYIWSQMHGDESTCTKAILDLFEVLKKEVAFSNFIQDNYTLYIIPLANPDGAEAYTRVNINRVDLNRDVNKCSQPESKILKNVFHNFKPDYCFNMHDQRTIYGVGVTNKSAIISFLAPAFNESRDVNVFRSKAMNVIGHMNKELQKHIPGHVGRYNDAYCDSCFGDYFSSQNGITILFEAGHHPNDYSRDLTRKYIFIGLLTALNNIYENVVVDDNNSEYFNIPENKVSFFDILYKNVKINEDNIEKIINFASQYTEVVDGDDIKFEAKIVLIEDADSEYFGHVEYDMKGELFHSKFSPVPINDLKSDFYIGENMEFVNGILKE